MERLVNAWFGIMFRRKKVQPKSNIQGFSKCLSTSQLIHLGIGATLGAGTYVVTGQVAAKIAGPAVVISFTIAAVTSILSGLCYAEFGSRVPQTTGSAYTYSYVTVGEVWAFVIGWNLILEYMIGTAADAAALSGSFDYAIGYRVKNWTITHIGEFSTPYLGEYPDLLSFAFTIVVTIILAFGVRESAWFTVTFNIFNIAVVLFIIITGAIYADKNNWSAGGGFFPYGASGVISGAATCFYAFVGFDIIATTGEESKNPSKSIPVAIVASLLIVFVAYFGVSTVLTLMVPYNKLDKLAPIPAAFGQRGLSWATYIISIGAICGLSSSLLGNLFPLPRIIYAMSKDGLLFQMFQCMSERTEVPVNATIYPGILTAIFALLFDLEELVEMMSIGTLLAYTLVSLCVLILRYQPDSYSDSSDVQSAVDSEPDSLDSAAEIVTIENLEWTSEDAAEKLRKRQQRRLARIASEKTSSGPTRPTDPAEGGTAKKGPSEETGLTASLDHPPSESKPGDLALAEKEAMVGSSIPGTHVADGIEGDRAGPTRGPVTGPVTRSSATSAANRLSEIEDADSADEEGEKKGLLPGKKSKDDKREPPSGKGKDSTLETGRDPTLETGRVVSCTCLLLFLWFFGFNSIILFAFDQLLEKKVWAIFLLVFFGILIFISVGVIYSMPQSKQKFGFMAPCVPALPIIAIYANTFLMLKLSNLTWIRFGAWMAIGGLIYLFYGSWNSVAKKQEAARRR